MPENIVSVRLEIRDQKTRMDLEGIISATDGFQVERVANGSCDLVILEIGEDPRKEFQLVHALHTSGKVREIFLTSSHLEPDLLIQALRTGVKEFFPQPIEREEVRNALLKFKERRGSMELGTRERKRGKIINIIGSKGGIGTTTIAVNLATSLIDSANSPSVVLIDMNLLFGEIPTFLDLDSVFNWGEVARNISRVDSTYLMSILSKHPSGLYVLPSPTGLDGANVATPEILDRLLGLLRGVFDFIVIDGGNSIDNISLKILEMSDIVLLIAILSLPCLTNLKRLLWTFEKLGYPQRENTKVILSRYDKKSLISLKEAEESINQKIFWLIPNDYVATMASINQGKTLSEVARGAEVTKRIRELASAFLPKEKEKGRPLSEHPR